MAVIDASMIQIADIRNASSSFVQRNVSGLGTGLTAVAAYSKTELYGKIIFFSHLLYVGLYFDQLPAQMRRQRRYGGKA